MKNMKLVLATAAIAASVTVFAAEGEAEPGTEGQGIGAIGWTPVQIGLMRLCPFRGASTGTSTALT